MMPLRPMHPKYPYRLVSGEKEDKVPSTLQELRLKIYGFGKPDF